MLHLCHLRPALVAVAAACFVMLGSASATADTTSVPPPSGFYLRPADMAQHTQLYGPTAPSSAANWNISQWGLPENLPPFDATGSTENRWAKVSFSNRVLQLSISSAASPCEHLYQTGRVLPNEWALVAAPNGIQEASFPRAIKGDFHPLSQLQHINLSTTLSIGQLTLNDTACKFTKASIVTTAVLVDKVSKQTLFYGTGTFLLARNGTFIPFEANRPGHAGLMYFTGFNTEFGGHNVFGYSDPVTTAYGEPEAAPGGAYSYTMDFLPRIISVIHLGQKYGMDQNLDHWIVRGYYEGQSIAGHVTLQTTWSNFSLTLVSQ